MQVLRAIHPFPAFVNAHLGILLHRKFLRRVKAGHGNDDGDHKGAAGAEGAGKRSSLSKAPPIALSAKVTAAAPPAPGTRGRRVSDATKSVVGMVAFDTLSDDAWTPVDDKEGAQDGEDGNHSSSDDSSSEDSDSYDSDSSSSSGDGRSDADYDALRSGGANELRPDTTAFSTHSPSLSSSHSHRQAPRWHPPIPPHVGARGAVQHYSLWPAPAAASPHCGDLGRKGAAHHTLFVRHHAHSTLPPPHQVKAATSEAATIVRKVTPMCNIIVNTTGQLTHLTLQVRRRSVVATSMPRHFTFSDDDDDNEEEGEGDGEASSDQTPTNKGGDSSDAGDSSSSAAGRHARGRRPRTPVPLASIVRR